jgi:hypothetical protein
MAAPVRSSRLRGIRGRSRTSRGQICIANERYNQRCNRSVEPPLVELVGGARRPSSWLPRKCLNVLIGTAAIVSTGCVEGRLAGGHGSLCRSKLPCLREDCAMLKIGMSVVISVVSIVGLTTTIALTSRQAPSFVGPALASSDGDACRKEICDSAVAACMRADLSLNPFAGTAAEKRTYCAQFFPGCMTRSVSPDVPWYSPETVARFLKCPS